MPQTRLVNDASTTRRVVEPVARIAALAVKRDTRSLRWFSWLPLLYGHIVLALSWSCHLDKLPSSFHNAELPGLPCTQLLLSHEDVRARTNCLRLRGGGEQFVSDADSKIPSDVREIFYVAPKKKWERYAGIS